VTTDKVLYFLSSYLVNLCQRLVNGILLFYSHKFTTVVVEFLAHDAVLACYALWPCVCLSVCLSICPSQVVF